jgi:hypothetical protein
LEGATLGEEKGMEGEMRRGCGIRQGGECGGQREAYKT